MITAAVFLLAAIILTAVSWRCREARAAAWLAGAFLILALAWPEALGRAKPRLWEWRVWTPKAEVLWFQIQEGKAIYAVLSIPGVSEPRLYALPWNQRVAEDLQRLRDKAERGSRIGLLYPFERSIENRNALAPHELPPPTLPKKDGESERQASPKLEM